MKTDRIDNGGNAHSNATYDQVAASVFAFADAMLAARKEGA